MTTIFLVSMFAICFLILSKVVEVKMNKAHFISDLFKKGDEKIHSLIDLFVFKYNRYKKIARIFVFEFLPSYLYELLVKSKDYVSKKYYSTGSGFRGKRVLRSDGSVSFFLERLSEDSSRIDSQKV
ncbi:MAG: hypothetical protein ABL917_03370 [Parcubacteria group bacterium]